MRRLATTVLWLLAAACEDDSYRAIGSDIRLLTQDQRLAEEPVLARLSAHGSRAIPQIEIALHTAPDRGRLRLFATLERIGDEEAIPVLRHFAVYDANPEVREVCARVLRGWGAQADARGKRAAVALLGIREKRARGEGPAPESAPSR